jgi:hypothetical protein
MHEHPLHGPSPPMLRPCAKAPLWPQRPLPQRRQWHDLITPLLIRVIHTARRKEKSHERHDSSRASATHGLSLWAPVDGSSGPLPSREPTAARGAGRSRAWLGVCPRRHAR